MKYLIISFILSVTFFTGCDSKEHDPVSPPIDNSKSFEINFLEYSENNYFIDEIYTVTSAELNIYYEFYGNFPPIVVNKYYVKDFEVYISLNRVEQNSFWAYASIDLPSRSASEKYSDSLRYNTSQIPGKEQVGRFRLLYEERDYIFHRETGYITFLIPLANEDFIAVAYRIENDSPDANDDIIYGEFFTDVINNSDSVGVLKLIKPQLLNSHYKEAWKLKMKNNYKITSNKGTITNLNLDIYLKKSDGTEINSINGVRLIELFGFDKISSDNSSGADGNFDYLEGLTFRPQTSEIIFPVIQPFGDNIPGLLREYKYQEIYDTIKAFLTLPENSFIIKGQYDTL